MPISVEQNRALALSLAPNFKDRVLHQSIATRRRGPGLPVPQPIGGVPGQPPYPTSPYSPVPTGYTPRPAYAPRDPNVPQYWSLDVPIPQLPSLDPNVLIQPTNQQQYQGQGWTGGVLKPVTFSAKIAGNTLVGIRSTKLYGPAIIEHIALSLDANGAGTDAWMVMRMDISQHDVVQAPTFQAGTMPSGYVRDDLTVFDKGTAYEATGPETHYDTGWYKYNYGTTSGARMLALPISIPIAFPFFWIKVYVQDEEASIRSFTLDATIRFLGEASLPVDPTSPFVMPANQTIMPPSSSTSGGGTNLGETSGIQG